MRTRLALVPGIALLLGVAVPVRADIIPVSSAISLRADADADGVTATDAKNQSQGAAVNPLAVSVRAEAVTEAAAFVSTTAAGTATWTCPGAGQVVLANVGWSGLFVGSGSASAGGGLDYSYTFRATGAGTMTLTFSVTASGSDLSGLNGFRFEFGGDQQTLGPDTSGSIAEALVAGTTYTLNLKNLAERESIQGSLDAHMTGSFTFDIVALAPLPSATIVPEPSSLALLALGGIGLAGWRRWERRRAGSTARRSTAGAPTCP